uniref:Agouti signaling peptide 2 n=1 Tax=Tetraodon nigroviridis TaxID=99883 RepID=J3JQT6_TETNG|nr:TPA: Agouti signaling peptide 2 [Tetraodon nigroviridis]
MKRFFLAFFFLHVASVAAGLFGGSDVKTSRSSLTGGRAQLPQNAGFWIQGTHRPLFARRKPYKRQRIMKKKPQAPRPSPTVRVDGGPSLSGCSQLTQGCSPQFGCCDPQALCHCRFFNAICFCRRFSQGH